MVNKILNPFENPVPRERVGGFSKYIRDQIKGLSVGEAMMVDVLGRDIDHDTRRHVKKAAEYVFGWKLALRKDAEGNLWVKRVG